MKTKAAYLGIYTALALIVSYVEMLIPFQIGVPGIKLGLTNIIIVAVLYQMTMRDAFWISVLRIFLTGFLFGNLFTIVYSLAGGILSLLIMWLLKKTGSLSLIGVSIAGGISHNTGQLVLAALLVDNFNLFYYLPVLLVSGLITGLLIGILCREVLKRLPGEIR